MRVIIAGSRTITNYNILESAVYNSQFVITEVVSGGAAGVDTLAIEYAYENDLLLTVFLANWEKYGRRAGLQRNHTMAKNADALIAIWDGQSRGTANMIEEATRLKLQVYKHII